MDEKDHLRLLLMRVILADKDKIKESAPELAELFVRIDNAAQLVPELAIAITRERAKR